MNGPEHYREAERLLARADDVAEQAKAAYLMQRAQVHATLALAAATVADRGIGPQMSSGWQAFHADPVWQELTQ